MQNRNKFSEVTQDVIDLSQLCINNSSIDPSLYSKYDVKRGLRDLNGRGVLTGLTEISEVCSTEEINGERIPIDGKLFYRGYDVEDIVKGFTSEDRFGFEEITYLLIFGNLPEKKALDTHARAHGWIDRNDRRDLDPYLIPCAIAPLARADGMQLAPCPGTRPAAEIPAIRARLAGSGKHLPANRAGRRDICHYSFTPLMYLSKYVVATAIAAHMSAEKP